MEALSEVALNGWTIMIFDAREVPDTKESVEAAKQEAQQVVQLWDRRALYATVVFVLSCGSVYPF